MTSSNHTSNTKVDECADRQNRLLNDSTFGQCNDVILIIYYWYNLRPISQFESLKMKQLHGRHPWVSPQKHQRFKANTGIFDNILYFPADRTTAPLLTLSTPNCSLYVSSNCCWLIANQLVDYQPASCWLHPHSCHRKYPISIPIY